MTEPIAARQPDGTFNRSTTLLLIVGNLILFGIGIGTTFITKVHLAGLAASLTAIAILTFVVLYKDSDDIRTALAGSFMFLYFAIVGSSLNGSVSAKLNEAGAKDVWTSFNTIVGVVIAFYFTGKSVEIVSKRAREVAATDSKS